MSLESIFHPKSVAVIGASRREAAVRAAERMSVYPQGEGCVVADARILLAHADG